RDRGPPYDALWRHLVDERGPKQAARMFAHVLGAVVELGERTTSERVGRALDSGEPVLLALRPSEPAPPPNAARGAAHPSARDRRRLRPRCRLRPPPRRLAAER